MSREAPALRSGLLSFYGVVMSLLTLLIIILIIFLVLGAGHGIR